MGEAAHNRLVSVDVAISYLKVETAIRVRANPCFIVDGRALAAEIGQGHKVTSVTLLTFGESEIFHESSSQPERE